MKVSLQQVSVYVRRQAAPILDNVQCVLEGGLIGLLGPNEAGKSTLLRLLAQVFQPTTGGIQYEAAGRKLSTFQARLASGYVPQRIALYEDWTLRQYLRYIGHLKCLPAERLEDEVHAVCFRFSLQRKLDQAMRACSIGEQRLMMIAQAFLGSPLFLWLDEPFVGLDMEIRHQFMEGLQEYAQDHLIVVATHLVEHAETDYDRLLYIREGRLQE